MATCAVDLMNTPLCSSALPVTAFKMPFPGNTDCRTQITVTGEADHRALARGGVYAEVQPLEFLIRKVNNLTSP